MSADQTRWTGDEYEEYAVPFKKPTSQVVGYALAALLDCAVDLFWLPIDALRDAHRRKRLAASAGRAGSHECA